MSAEGRSFSVTAESLAQLVGGLASREEALLRQVLALFPVPRPEHAAQLMAAIHSAVPEALLRDAVLFDVYRPKPVKGADAAPTTGLAPGEKSLAVRLTLGSGEVTLTEADIDAAVQAVVAQLAAQTGARLRV